MTRMILTWVCIITTNEAASLGEGCISNENCTDNGAICEESSKKCVCNTGDGYEQDDGACKPSPITVSLTGPDSSVKYGSSINFTATIITGASVTAVAWQKVGSGGSLSNITVNSTKYTQTGDPESGTVVLTIHNLKYSDEASYQIQVNNSHGETNTSNRVSLHLSGDPPIVSVSGPTQSGDSVIIGCNATITPDSPAITTIKWKKDGKDIDIANSNGKYSGGTVDSPALTINTVDSGDAGLYHCVATNPTASTASDNNVNLAPPSDVKVTGTTSVVHNSTATFNGSYTSVLPSVTIKWQKQGTDNNYKDIDIGSSDGKYAGSNITGTSPKLVINYVKFTDRTSYRMVVTNGVGSTNSDQITLDVTGAKPIINIISINPTVYGQSATITAHVASDPPATGYVWQKSVNDTPENITSTDKYNLTGNITEGNFSVSLTIYDVKFSDQANYTLVVTNSVGSHTSNAVTLNVTGGDLTVTTGPDVTGRYGGSVTISCTVEGPEVNKILWKKYSGNTPVKDIPTNGSKYTGGTVSTPALTINSLTDDDMGQYQCTASNPGGPYSSNSKATVTLNYGQFNEDCTTTEPCNASSNLICLNGKCLCNTTYYHRNNTCYLRSGLAPSISFINSTTTQFSVFWSHPSVDYDLVISYNVSWRQNGGSTSGQKTVERGKNTTTVNSDLMSGQRYIVTVSAVVRLTDPEETITIDSYEKEERLDPRPPGSILHSESSFAHNNLTLKWTSPSKTFVTSYDVMIDGESQSTGNNNPWLHFTMKSLTPGKYYVVSIVTISGTSNEPTGEKRSTAYTETIRITPTKPGPPTNIKCPQSPMDTSLIISWTAPSNPNGQIVMYQISVNPGNIIKTVDNSSTYNVMELNPEQQYSFIVWTINDADEAIRRSDASQPVICKTLAGVSTPPTNLTVHEVQSRDFRISFGSPKNVSGLLSGYKIVIFKGLICVKQILLSGTDDCPQCVQTNGCPPSENSTIDLSQPVIYNISGLDPYTSYLVRVAAINGQGEGYPYNVTVKTEEEVPEKPGQITASNIQAKTLTLSWNVAGPSPGNTTYIIEVYEGTDDTGTNFILKQPKRYTYGFQQKSLSIIELEEYWPYKFKVIAATVKGTSESDVSDIVRTKQAAPGQVENLTVNIKEGNYREAYAYWNIPSLRNRNGVLENYHFTITNQGTENLTGTIPVSLSIQRVEQNFTVVPEETYTVTVYVTNNESMSSKEALHTYKIPAGRPPIDNNVELISTVPGQHKSSQQTITVELNTDFFRNDLNGKQVLFGITVCEESKCTDQGSLSMKENWEGLPNWHDASKNGFPLYRVTNQTYMDKIKNGGSRRKRSTLSEFTIGQDTECFSKGSNVYCNGPLNSGQSYRVILFACTNGGCTHSVQYGPYSTIKIIVEEKFPVGAVVGGVVAVIAAVLVVIIAVVVSKRRRLGTTSKYTEKLETVVDMEDPVPKNIPRKRPIRLRELADKVAEKHKDSNLYFAREYEDLKTLSAKHATEMSELDSNKLKNRYVNILPFDVTRVKLQLTEDDDPSTDFINANYLPGYKSEREYIATQGPIPGTIDDFWRMIWEQNVSIIVMLTLCKEEGRVKCEMYWPENVKEPKQYGDLVVETVSCSTVNFYDFRIFKIKLGDTTRTLKHFHFLQWKDFSANVQNDVMIDFIKNVRNHIRPPDMNGPVVVHCSAGVGRTGTYCALDHLFQVIDEHDLDHSIDIFDLVLNLREHRMFMVQTEQQYIFIHDCLKDYLERKLKQEQGGDECLYENQAFVADDPAEESLYQNYSNQRTDL
ncbi:receptor-type tyrosine-protein phosphatase delta-like [Saccostrea cucullata]|uniref:receptor-type tyrosine-protein phosphatase delta-like n=1 Tax=Saccostrea cuccullata TaxID=36930 RepID=UPI002ED3D22B